MQGQFLGQIQPMAINFAPRGWATCAAQLLAIASNQALFAILGTTYGGDGIRTFGLPDLRGRVAIHQGQGPGLSPYSLGQISGSTTTTMLASNMPLHIHSFSVNNQTSSQVGPGGNALAQGGVVSGANLLLYGPAAGVTMSPNTIAPSGSSIPFSIMQPVLAIQYNIATSGIFPSRN